MKYRIGCGWLLWWCLSAWLWAAPASDVDPRSLLPADLPQRPFILADDENFAPFSFFSRTDQFTGLFPELYREAFRRLGIELNYRPYPWRRAQQLVAEGQADAMVTIPTPTRLAFLKASDPLYVEHIAIWTRKSHPQRSYLMQVTELSELQGFRLVEMRGNGWGEYHLTRPEYGLDVVWVTENTLARMVAHGRVDVAIMPLLTTRHFLLEQEPALMSQLVHSNRYLDGSPFCLLIHQNSPYAGIIPAFNAALAQMRADGSYQRILFRFVYQ